MYLILCFLEFFLFFIIKALDITVKFEPSSPASGQKATDSIAHQSRLVPPLWLCLALLPWASKGGLSIYHLSKWFLRGANLWQSRNGGFLMQHVYKKSVIISNHHSECMRKEFNNRWVETKSWVGLFCRVDNKYQSWDSHWNVQFQVWRHSVVLMRIQLLLIVQRDFSKVPDFIFPLNLSVQITCKHLHLATRTKIQNDQFSLLGLGVMIASQCLQDW